jgi:agmatine deiminase
MMFDKTPLEAGFKMPAEWEQHEGTWLQWPQNKIYERYELKLEGIWLDMVDALHDHENVHIIIADERQRDHVVQQLQYHGIGSKNVDFYIIPCDDVWARDNGPIFVVNNLGEVVITDWNFNGWGARFPHELDNQVPSAIADQLNMPIYDAPMVLEAGAVEVNGEGTFLATRSSIIDPYRNPGMSQTDIEEVLSQYLGVDHFIWLTGAGRGECDLWGDETDSHIDIVARFTDESTILYNWTDDEFEPRYEFLNKSYRELKESTCETGKPPDLVPLPLPEVHQTTSMTSWRKNTFTDAAYSNYLIANQVALVPTYGHANDDRSLEIIGEHFPDREIIGIEVVALIEHGGAIGCVTQPQPAPVNPDNSNL